MKNDIRALDLNLLKALDELMDEGSVGPAAQHRVVHAIAGCPICYSSNFRALLTEGGVISCLRAAAKILPS